MTDKPTLPPPPVPMEPFQLVAVSEIPRPGPTMALIAEKLVVIDKVFDIASQVLKRQQQLGLMLDGYGSNHGRRLNDVQTELALMRATAPTVETGTETDETETEAPQGQKARAVKLTGKVLMYGATLAALVRMVGNFFPEYKDTIDGILEGVGL